MKDFRVMFSEGQVKKNRTCGRMFMEVLVRSVECRKRVNFCEV